MVLLYKLLNLFKRKKPVDLLLSYNVDKLAREIEIAALDLHKFTKDPVYMALKKVFSNSRNIQILDMNKSIDEKGYEFHRGRLAALTDMCEYFTHTVEDLRFQKHIRDKMNADKSSNVRELRRGKNG